ncbi:MAG: endonuclease/exonuclease/phosphatase family protein [Luteolibacter sp.]
MFRRRLGWILVGLSLLLHIFTVYCFARQPDRFAAYTVMPIWIWGGVGLFLSTVAYYFLRASLSLVMTAVWAVTLLVGADEARVLANFGKSAPLPGPALKYEGKPLIRVATLNCSFFMYGDGNPAKEIAAWQPDIVLLQDISAPQVRQIADVLFGGRGDYRAHDTNAIVTRWQIKREIRNPTQRDHQVTILTDSGLSIEVVNVHLRTAATDLRFWERTAWHDHRTNRILREQELALTRNILEQTTTFPTATILGGDFNAPASDVVHRQLARDFVDTFASAGTGWGDTFQRRFPILRIDHIYATRHFTPVRCCAVTIRSSDHRMVVADLLAN